MFIPRSLRVYGNGHSLAGQPVRREIAALPVEDGGSIALSVGGHEVVTIGFWDAGP